jgi:hypothetical protein
MSSPGYNSENTNSNISGNTPQGYSGAAASTVNTAITAGGNLWTSWKNRRATEKMNDENWKRQQEVNALNRQYANEDWEKTAKYNSPEQQMSRLKEAGLNPNLVYGKFDGGNMQMPKTPSAQTDKAQKINYDNPLAGVDALGNYYAVRQNEMNLAMMKQQIKGQQLQNQKTSLLNQVLAQDTPILLNESLDRKSERLNKRLILDSTQQQAEAKEQGAWIDLKIKDDLYKNDAHFLDYFQKQINLESSEIKQEQMKQVLEILKTDDARKKLELQLYELGMQPNDPFYYRVMVRLARRMMD